MRMARRLKDLTILVTAAGSPGAPGLMKSLRANGERAVRLIGSDSDPEASGLFLADEAYLEPPSTAENYAAALLAICVRERVDVIVPNTGLVPLSDSLSNFEENGTRVLVSRNTNALRLAGNKASLFKILRGMGLPTPEFAVVRDIDEFQKAVFGLGHPAQEVCFKPAAAEGTRGFRVLKGVDERLTALLEEKPDLTATGFSDVVPVLGAAKTFPELVVMEYLPGKEYSVDLLLVGGRAVASVPRYRKVTKLGLSTVGVVEGDDEVVRLAEHAASGLGLDYNVNVQIKYSRNGEPRIIEVNPRVSGTLVLSAGANVNLAYLGVKAVLGEPFAVPTLKRGVKMIRYWSEVFVDASGVTYSV